MSFADAFSMRPLTGRFVHPIGLGCMGMSEFYGATDDEQSITTLHAAFDLGVTHLDTADTYGHGHNEELLGRLLNGLGLPVGDMLVQATKFGIVREPSRDERRIDNTQADVCTACDACLAWA